MKKLKVYGYYTLFSVLLFSSCEKDGTEKRCDKGFTGQNCDQEITPTRIQVMAIESIMLPPFDTDGSNWDPLGGKPDVYFRILEQASGNIVYTSGTLANANPTTGILDDLSGSGVLINSPMIKYIIEAWDDDDLDADDLMGGIIFTPYIKGQKFPLQVPLNCSGCNTSWNLNFTYLF
jgi:hypothetical protein